jgi:6-pyruvoyl-tetrahydropterin synthase
MNGLTLSKRFEFGAAHRFYRTDWPHEKNIQTFGKNAGGVFGHGHNYEAYFILSGDIQNDGMVIELSKVKTHILDSVLSKYDHFFLNQDTAPFNQGIQPSVVNIAKHLLSDAILAFKDWPLTVTACHLIEKPSLEATVYADGHQELHYFLTLPSIPTRLMYQNEWASFSHPIQLRLTTEHKDDPLLETFVHHQFIQEKLQEWQTNTHAVLANTLPEFFPSLETWAYTWWAPLKTIVSDLKRIKLTSFNEQSCEYSGQSIVLRSRIEHLLSGHRLCDPTHSPEKNVDTFGRCSRHHGHTFKVEISTEYAIQTLDEIHLNQIYTPEIDTLKKEWSYHSLSEECQEFKHQLATCENILLTLKKRLNTLPLARLRIWETQNNRFAWRK